MRDALVADALTLIRDALGPRMVVLAEQIMLDPEGWGMNEAAPANAQELAGFIIGCMTSYIYDAGDEIHRDLPEEQAVMRSFFYALADDWVKTSNAKLEARLTGTEGVVKQT